MHLETKQGTSNNNEVDAVDNDAPSSSHSDNEAMQNGFHNELDNAGNESSDNDDELPYNLEVFRIPIHNLNDLHIEEHDDDTEHDSSNGEEEEDEASEGNLYDWNYDQERNSSNESSDGNQEDHQNVDESDNQQQTASTSSEEDYPNHVQQELPNHSDNFNIVQQVASNNPDNEDVNNAQQNASHNLGNAYQNFSERVVVPCDIDFIDSEDATNYETSHSSNYDTYSHAHVEVPKSPAFGSSLSYGGPSNSGLSSYPSREQHYGTQGIAGYSQSSDCGIQGNPNYHNMQTSYDVSGEPVFDTSYLSQYDAEGNPGSAEQQLLPIYNISDNPRQLPDYHTLLRRNNRGDYINGFVLNNWHNLGPNVSNHYRFPGPYILNDSTRNIHGNVVSYSRNNTAPYPRDYTGSHSINHSASAHPNPTRNDYIRHTNMTRNNASYRDPQASRYSALGNLGGETMQSTNYIAPSTRASETSNSSVYGAPNMTGYGIPTLFGVNSHLSPEHGTLVSSVFPPHSFDYGNPPSSSNNSPAGSYYNSIPHDFNHATPYSGYPAPGRYATPGQAFDSTAPYYGGPVIYGNGIPGHGIPRSFAYIAPGSNGYVVVPIFNAYGRRGFFGYIDPRNGFLGYFGIPVVQDFSGHSGPNSISNGNANSADYGAWGMSGFGASDLSNSLAHNPANYADLSNTDNGSLSSSAYWNYHMGRAILRLLIPDERYIPVVRLQSEAAAIENDAHDDPREPEPGPSGEQNRRPPLNSDSTTQCRDFFTRQRRRDR